MITKPRRYLISSLLTIFLISSSNSLAETRYTLNAKDILDQKIKENSLLLKNVIRQKIYESCFIDWWKNLSNGLSDRDSNTLLKVCLGAGLATAEKTFGLKNFKLIEEEQ